MTRFLVKCRTALVLEAKDERDAKARYIEELLKGGFAYTIDEVDNHVIKERESAGN